MCFAKSLGVNTDPWEKSGLCLSDLAAVDEIAARESLDGVVVMALWSGSLRCHGTDSLGKVWLCNKSAEDYGQD